MSTLITVLHVLVCIFLMLTVLLQSGKGGMGAAFGGGGGTQTVFGGSGAGGFLRKMTVAAAVIFMLTSMTLAWLSSRTGTDALKRYSAQQRRAAQLKKAARQEALTGIRDGGVEATTVGDGGTETIPPTDEFTDLPGDQTTGGEAEPPLGGSEEPPPIEPADEPETGAAGGDSQPRAPPTDPNE